MALSAGTRLGPYEILAPLGAGGMGEVYRAKDTRLDRTVAIKVLPSHLSDDAGLKARFEREARAVSSLNHPNICTLYDIGSENGVDFMVMEYIEGDTLADRLKTGALPLDQALKCAVEIADALDNAHRQGVVHRDLKPGNVILTQLGAKLLDFGLAKLRVEELDPAALSALPTETKPLTEKGSILGTFQYMAPEQIEGREADTRTDIFALGAVLFEMVAGRRAFEGKSKMEVADAILNAEPPRLSELQPLSSPPLDRLVQRCLAKDSRARWQTAYDLKEELDWIAGSPAKEGPIPSDRASRRLVLPLLLGTVAGALAASVAWNGGSPPPQPVRRFAVTIPDGQRLASSESVLAISPNGEAIAYATQDGLYLRYLDSLEVNAISGTAHALAPFFSPDGQQIGYWDEAEHKLKAVSVRGGAPLTLCDADRVRGTSSWGPDGIIVFAAPAGIVRVSGRGGLPEVLIPLEYGENASGPQVLPGGSAVLFTLESSQQDSLDAKIIVHSLETDEQRVLVNGTAGRYVPTGHLLYAQGRTLFAVTFDVHRLEVTGNPVPVLDGSGLDEIGLAFSEDGTLVYASTFFEERMLVWVDRTGRETPATAFLDNYMPQPRLSPDGSRLAVTIAAREGNYDIWVLDLKRGTRMRLTTEGRYNTRPVWTPDGTRIAFQSDRAGNPDLYWKRADGSGEAEALLKRAGDQWPDDWSPDGAVLAFEQPRLGSVSARDIWLLSLADGPVPFSVTPFRERQASFSPDGRRLAYISDESGDFEVYVQEYPSPGRKVPISVNGGREPVWSRAGLELFYRTGNQMMVVDVQGEPTTASAPRSLFETSPDFESNPWMRSYDVSRDGQQFLMIRDARPSQGVSQAEPIHVVLNWFEELKRLVPTD